MSEPVTIERLERGLALCAYLVERDGPVVAPLFERLERELAAMRQTQDTVSRTKRLLEIYSARHPCLSLAPPIEGEGGDVHSIAPRRPQP